jgi:hypothetical protein
MTRLTLATLAATFAKQSNRLTHHSPVSSTSITHPA